VKVLIIQTAFIGDVILATPVISELHRCQPGFTIDVLVRKGNESLLENFPGIRSVLVWDKRNSKTKQLLSILSKFEKKNTTSLSTCSDLHQQDYSQLSVQPKQELDLIKTRLPLHFPRRYHTRSEKTTTDTKHSAIWSLLQIMA
jgi:ADP-heptose:LPS heptosyltransferase